MWTLGKPDELRDKVLFIDARNYYTVVDRTLNEWSEWQLKNLAAIVWLYRGEADKYKALIREYHQYLGEDPFTQTLTEVDALIKEKRAEAKAAVESTEKRDRKSVQAKYDEQIADLEEMLKVAKEACWLEEKFGDGEYADVPGLCMLADILEIENKGWSLTPGAYVGVAPVEDDGVDFHARMKEIHEELKTLQAQSNELMATISKNMEEMGL